MSRGGEGRWCIEASHQDGADTPCSQAGPAWWRVRYGRAVYGPQPSQRARWHLLKTSKSLYYGNVPGSAWIVDKAEEDIAVLRETFEMKHAAREAARAELYRAFAGFGAAWDYYVAVCHECAVAMKTYMTLKCDVESNPIRARAALTAGFVADE